MIIVGSLAVLAIFLVTGWAITTEMLQQRHWRKRVESGDQQIVEALLSEALTTWKQARPPRGLPTNLWAGVQAAQVVSVAADSAVVSSSAEGEFRTEGGRRVQVSTALDEALALAAKLVDMLLYDVPNLRLASVRADIYSTFTGSDGTPVQRPILTTTVHRNDAEALSWETLPPAEILARFETRYDRSPSGQGLPIDIETAAVTEAG